MKMLAAMMALLLALLVEATAAPQMGEEDVLDLFADLPVRFVVEKGEEGEQGRIFRLRSAQPMESIEQDPAGSLYLRATVTISTLADAGIATTEVGRRLAAADPDIGLSYAWDFVTTVDNLVVHLHADCIFSEESFLKLSRSLVGSDPGSQVSFSCRCGGGCRAGAPFPLDPVDSIRLPPVRRRVAVKEGDYDNRLDPSGAWTSRIGELSLMHYANGLSFSYIAVFGPAAHTCEGAGVAGLVATDRYELSDEQGSVAFVITEGEVRMELIEGIASFCGSGWAGDSFAIGNFEPPTECNVAAKRSHFHVVDTLDRESRRAYVVRGDLVEVAPAHHTGDEGWALGRFVAPRDTTVGLLARGDLECPAD